jgi:hypothetical protein
MTTEERFERLEHVTANTAANLDKLSQVTASTLDKLSQVTAAIAASVAAHDDQIEKLIQVAEIERREWAQLRREFQPI